MDDTGKMRLMALHTHRVGRAYRCVKTIANRHGSNVLGAFFVLAFVCSAFAYDGHMLTSARVNGDFATVPRATDSAQAASLDSQIWHSGPYGDTASVSLRTVAAKFSYQRRCLSQAIYFEARGESHEGQLAVAEVILNRVADPSYPDNICGVVFQGAHRKTGCQFSFTCDAVPDRPFDQLSWRKAERLARAFTEGSLTQTLADTATHYHADYVNPRWAKRLVRLGQIGKHIFYRRPGRGNQRVASRS